MSLHLIDIGFFLLALIAVLLHATYLVEVVRDRRSLRQATNDGTLLELGVSPERVLSMHDTADQFVAVESFRMSINVIVFLIGLGTLFARYFVLWFLLVIPLASMLSSFINLRRRWFPRRDQLDYMLHLRARYDRPKK